MESISPSTLNFAPCRRSSVAGVRVPPGVPRSSSVDRAQPTVQRGPKHYATETGVRARLEFG